MQMEQLSSMLQLIHPNISPYFSYIRHWHPFLGLALLPGGQYRQLILPALARSVKNFNSSMLSLD
jgi:hypothetical protein